MSLEYPLDKSGIRLLADVDDADLVIFTVEATEICLVVQREVVRAETVWAGRRLLHIVAVGDAALVLACDSAQTGRVESDIKRAEVKFADDQRLFDLRVEVVYRICRIYLIAVELEDVDIFRAGRERLARQPRVAYAEVQVVLVDAVYLLGHDSHILAYHFARERPGVV